MRRQGIGDMRGYVEKAFVVAIRLDSRRADDGRERQSGSQGFRQRQQIRFDAEMLKGEILAKPAKGRLGLIENEQHAAPFAMLLDFLPIPLGRHDNPAGAFHRLGNDRGKRAGRLGIDQLEPDLEAGAVAGFAAMPNRAAIGVRHRQRQRPWHHRAIALAPGHIVDGLRTRGHAMPGAEETHDLELPGMKLGHLDGRLIGFGSGAEKHGLGERWREERGRGDATVRRLAGSACR